MNGPGVIRPEDDAVVAHAWIPVPEPSVRTAVWRPGLIVSHVDGGPTGRRNPVDLPVSEERDLPGVGRPERLESADRILEPLRRQRVDSADPDALTCTTIL